MDTKLLAIINRRNKKYTDIKSQEDFDNRKTNKYLRILCHICIKPYEDITGAGTWDMSKCPDMSTMFQEYEGKIPITIENWDTSNVSYMNCMFYGCKSQIPDIGKWDISNVSDMGFMFANCKGQIPNISNWDTSNIHTIGMLYNCN